MIMKDPIINYKSEIDARTKQIVDDYWKKEKGKFVSPVTQLLAKYDLKVGALETIIKINSSHEEFFDDCIDCKMEISKIVYLRRNISNFPHWYDRRCDTCSNNFNILNNENSKLKKQQLHNEIKLKLEKGINEKKWLILLPSELVILLLIVSNKTKHNIIKFVFKNNFFDKSIWNVVDNLSKLNLVIVERTDSGSVVNFHFDERLEGLIINKIPVTSLINDVLSLSLCKKNNSIKAGDPEYSGTFMLPEDIILNKNVLYIYAGWRNSDGSINFKFTPEHKITKKPIQGNLDKEPELRLYLPKMDNNFDTDDNLDDENWRGDDLNDPYPF